MCPCALLQGLLQPDSHPKQPNKTTTGSFYAPSSSQIHTLPGHVNPKASPRGRREIRCTSVEVRRRARGVEKAAGGRAYPRVQLGCLHKHPTHSSASFREPGQAGSKFCIFCGVLRLAIVGPSASPWEIKHQAKWHTAKIQYASCDDGLRRKYRCWRA